MIVSKAQGHGDSHTQCLHKWTINFLKTGELPLHWLGHAQSTPQPKGDGQLIVVSKLLTSEWGCLHNGNKSVHHFFFAPFISDLFSERLRLSSRLARTVMGISFSTEELLTQVNSAIDIFKGLSKGKSKALFLFDSAPSHQKQAPDALQSLHKKCQKVCPFSHFISSLIFINTGPKMGWAHHLGWVCMRCGQLLNGNTQSFYFLNNHPSMPSWFKGMEQIIQERSL